MRYFYLLSVLSLTTCRMPSEFSYKQEKSVLQYRLPGSDCRGKKQKYSYGSSVNFTIKNECSYGDISLSRKDQVYYSLGSKQISTLTTGNDWGAIINGVTAWSATFYSDGKPQTLQFRYPQKLQGILWSQVTLSPDGKITQGVTANETEINGIWVRGGYPVYVDATGKLRVDQMILSRDQEVQGVWWAKDSYLVMSPDGKILSGQIAPQGATVNGLSLQGRTPLAFYPNGKIQTATLAKPQSIQGMMLSGSMSFYESGLLYSAILAAPMTLGGLQLVAGTSLLFSADGALTSASKYLSLDEKVAGVICPAGSTLYFEKNTLKAELCVPSASYVTADASGNLSTVLLAQDQPIRDVLYQKGQMIYFSPSGKILSAMLAEPSKLDGHLFPAGTHFALDDKGALLGAEFLLDSDASMFGADCKAGEVLVTTRAAKGSLQGYCAATYAGLSVEGSISYLSLMRAANIQGVPCMGDVSFYPGGKLASAVLSKAAQVQGISLAASSSVSFYESGKLQYINLAEPLLIQKILFEGEVELYESGKVSYGMLSKDSVIQGKKFFAGAYLEFNEDGKLISESDSEEAPIKKPVPAPTPIKQPLELEVE